MPSGPVNTKSCFSMLSFFWFQLVRLIKVGAYFFSNRFQKLSSRSLFSFLDMLRNLLVIVWSHNEAAGAKMNGLPRKWFGISGSL